MESSCSAPSSVKRKMRPREAANTGGGGDDNGETHTALVSARSIKSPTRSLPPPPRIQPSPTLRSSFPSKEPRNAWRDRLSLTTIDSTIIQRLQDHPTMEIREPIVHTYFGTGIISSDRAKRRFPLQKRGEREREVEKFI